MSCYLLESNFKLKSSAEKTLVAVDRYWRKIPSGQSSWRHRCFGLSCEGWFGSLRWIGWLAVVRVRNFGGQVTKGARGMSWH